MSTELKEVPRIYDSSVVDVPARLRALADYIEAGNMGRVLTAVVCTLSVPEHYLKPGSWTEPQRREANTFSMGPLSDAAACCALLTQQIPMLAANAITNAPL